MLKLRILILFLIGLAANIFAQPSNYDANISFGFTGNFTLNTPVNGIQRISFQATGASSPLDSTFTIVSSGGEHEWYNNSLIMNIIEDLAYDNAEAGIQFESGLTSQNGIRPMPTIGKYYHFQIKGLDFSNRKFIIMATDNAPVEFAATNPVTFPSTVPPGVSPEITINLAGPKSEQEKIFIRFTNQSDFSSSIVKQASYNSVDNTATVSIPGSAFEGDIIYFNVFTTTTCFDCFGGNQEYDLATLRLENNSGSNYSITVGVPWQTVNDGNWADAATWNYAQVPPAGNGNTNNIGNVLVNHDVILDQSLDAVALTIGIDGSLTCNSALSVWVQSIVNQGALSFNAGTIQFQPFFANYPSLTGNGTAALFDVWIGSATYIPASTTINGFLRFLYGDDVSYLRKENLSGGLPVRINSNAEVPALGDESTLFYVEDEITDANRHSLGIGTNSENWPAKLYIRNSVTLSVTTPIVLEEVELFSIHQSSFIDNGMVSGTVDDPLVIKSNWDMLQSDEWFTLSAPVGGMTILGSDFVPNTNPLPTNFNLFSFNEPAPSLYWKNIRSADNSPNPAFDLQFATGRGYLYSGSSGDYQFAGSLNTGDIGVTLSYTDAGTQGYNLLGNPFPSNYIWNSSENDRSAFEDDFVYVYNSLKVGGPGYDAINDIVRHGRGFFVKVKPAYHNTTFTFKDNLRTADFYLPETKANSSAGKLAVSFGNSNNYDVAEYRLNSNAEFLRDRNDALKFFSMEDWMPQLYSISSDGKQLSINSIPEITGSTTLPLGIIVPAAGDYFLKLDVMEGEFLAQTVYLEDKLLGTSIELQKDNKYYFSAHPQDDSHRFVLHFAPLGVQEIERPDRVIAYYSAGALHLPVVKEQSDLQVFDLHGRLLHSQRIEPGVFSKPLSLSTGIYVVRLMGATQSQSVKVLVK